jgi:hypothetical protein
LSRLNLRPSTPSVSPRMGSERRAT